MKVMTKQEERDRRLYKKQNKKFRKEMIKMIKEMGPWDYNYILFFMYKSLVRMKEYYELDYNVCALDNPSDPTRAEVASRAVELFDHYYEICETFDSNRKETEQDSLKELFDYLGKNIFYLWD